MNTNKFSMLSDDFKRTSKPRRPDDKRQDDRTDERKQDRKKYDTRREFQPRDKNPQHKQRIIQSLTAEEMQPKPFYEANPDTDVEHGNKHFLNSSWKVWEHLLNDENREDDYRSIYTIDTIGSFWRFFNNFHHLDRATYQYYVMRDNITPRWEDNDNRNGGIYSLRMDMHCNNNSRVGTIDIGVKFMVFATMLIVNESFIESLDCDIQQINGISYMIRNNSVYIKIWYKRYDSSIESYLPQQVFQRLTTELAKFQSHRPPVKTHGTSYDKKIVSVMNMEIKPAY